MKTLFTAREVSAIFRVSISTVNRFIRSHNIATVKQGRTKRVSLHDVAGLASRYDEPSVSPGPNPTILFINVSLRLGSALKIPPVGIASVMAFVDEAGYEFEVFDIDLNDWDDDVVEAYIKFNHHDIVAYGSIVTHYKWMKWLTKTIKAYHPSTYTIVGNSVGGSCHEVFMSNCPADFVVSGEGEETTLHLINVLKVNGNFADINGLVWRNTDGKIIKNPPRKATRYLDDLPVIRWEKYFDVERYIDKCKRIATGVNDYEDIVAFPVSTSRGCAFRCTFCHFVYWHDKYRHKSPSRIVEEIRYLQESFGVNFVAFWDDLSFASLTQVENLCDEIIESGLKIQWSAAVRADLFGNTKHSYEKRVKIANKMKKAGCTLAGYSLESGDPDILKMMNKRIEPEYFTEQVRVLNEVGVESGTSVVFGYPNETKETIRKTFQMCHDIGIYPSIGYLLPLPYTEMYKYALDNGFITDEDRFLNDITERQDLIINMTSLPDDEIKQLILDEAECLNKTLNLGFTDLIKTGDKQNQERWKRRENDVALDYAYVNFDEETSHLVGSEAT